MSRPEIIVIGASTGGVVALTQLIQDLPSQLPAAIFIVVHTPANLPCGLPQILQNCGKLPAVHAVDGAAIEQGCIYIAPPNRHLLVKRDYMHVVIEPKENGFRPAIDPLFRTAAVAYDKRVVGIVLSGGLFDGAAGLMEIKQRGGVAIVQDPNEALVSTMPQTAINRVAVDYILPIANMASVLLDLVYEAKPH
ncbi:MAG: chemotaxis protein CheB [Coleofasciculus sp. Co-bin14]|nr:chemotaxis protein CheB [Coleofasciculus sp. Co-bin14]